MIYNLLGKIFYRDLTRWEQRRRINNIIGILLAAVLTGASVGYFIIRENSSRH